MQTHTLYLTAQEESCWGTLPQGLRQGSAVVREEHTSHETADELLMRYEMASFNDPKCARLSAMAQAAQRPEDIERVARSFDVSTLSAVDMGELFFVIGTNWMGHIIRTLLEHAQSSEDLEGIAHLTAVRRALHETNDSLPPRSV